MAGDYGSVPWGTSRFSQLLAIIAGCIAVFGFANLLTDNDIIAGIGSKDIPVAPSSLLCIGTIAIALIMMNIPQRGVMRKATTFASAATALIISSSSMYTFLSGSSWDLEGWLYPYDRSLNGIPLRHMSPMAAVAFIAISSSLILLEIAGQRRRWARQASAVLGTGSVAVGFVGTLGYAYDSPILYGSSIRPIALVSALSLMVLGAALTLVSGLDKWPLRAFVGPSAKARLLRTFLPATVLIVLLTDWFGSAFLHGLSNPAIVSSLLALASAGAAFLVVFKLAQSIGDELDSSNRRLNEARAALITANRQLEQRSAELSQLNRELEAFSYSVSHDLRAPLRSIDGFSYSLSEKLGDGPISDEIKSDLARVRTATQRMDRLIDDLLKLSKVTKAELKMQDLDLAVIAERIVARLRQADPDRTVTFKNVESAPARGDPQLLEVALENLINNAWKFTSKRPQASIEFGATPDSGPTIYFVKDDGAGFDQDRAEKLFAPFQRLHNDGEFPGTGIGLATVNRVIARHLGEVWAEGAVGKGATFYFTLGQKRRGI